MNRRAFFKTTLGVAVAAPFIARAAAAAPAAVVAREWTAPAGWTRPMQYTAAELNAHILSNDEYLRQFFEANHPG